MPRRPTRVPGFPRLAVTLAAVLTCGAAAAAAPAGDLAGLRPPSWAESGAAFASAPSRIGPARVALLAPRPAVRAAAPRTPVAARRPVTAVALAWLNRGGIAVHPRRTRRSALAGLPALPTPAAAPVVAEPPPARRPLVAAKPAPRFDDYELVALPLPAARPAADRVAAGTSALERFLRSSRPGDWAGADVRRTAANPAAPPAGSRPVVR